MEERFRFRAITDGLHSIRVGRMPMSPLIDEVIDGKRVSRMSAMALTYRLHELGHAHRLTSS
jgi:hypothetical protein